MDNNQSQVRSGTASGQGNNIQSGNIQSYPDSGTAAMEVIGGIFPVILFLFEPFRLSKSRRLYFRHGRRDFYLSQIVTMIKCPIAKITGVSLPSSVTIIGEDAFAGCSNLVSISGGENLTEIRDRAFEGCPISTIKIPAQL